MIHKRNGHFLNTGNEAFYLDCIRVVSDIHSICEEEERLEVIQLIIISMFFLLLYLCLFTFCAWVIGKLFPRSWLRIETHRNESRNRKMRLNWIIRKPFNIYNEFYIKESVPQRVFLPRQKFERYFFFASLKKTHNFSSFSARIKRNIKKRITWSNDDDFLSPFVSSSFFRFFPRLWWNLTHQHQFLKRW